MFSRVCVKVDSDRRVGWCGRQGRDELLERDRRGHHVGDAVAGVGDEGLVAGPADRLGEVVNEHDHLVGASGALGEVQSKPERVTPFHVYIGGEVLPTG